MVTEGKESSFKGKTSRKRKKKYMGHPSEIYTTKELRRHGKATQNEKKNNEKDTASLSYRESNKKSAVREMNRKVDSGKYSAGVRAGGVEYDVDETNRHISSATRLLSLLRSRISMRMRSLESLGTVGVS